MSADPALGASDAGQSSESVVPPSSEADARPLDPAVDVAAAAATPETTTDFAERSQVTGVGGMTTSRATSASVKPQRKTCILKLDGCHYTIGTNDSRTAIAAGNRLLLSF